VGDKTVNIVNFVNVIEPPLFAEHRARPPQPRPPIRPCGQACS
jgi:hypothetical protein